MDKLDTSLAPTNRPAPVSNENSGNSSSVPVQGPPPQGYGLLDSNGIKSEYEDLTRALETRKTKLVRASKTLSDAVPFLARMQALLSQRGAGRKKVLLAAEVPTWTDFLAEYSAQLGYSPRQVTNLIRDHREQAKPSTKPKVTCSCKPVLMSVLAWLEECGDCLPVILSDTCRNINLYLSGKETFREWKAMDHELRVRRQHALADQAATEDGAVLPARPRYIM